MAPLAAPEPMNTTTNHSKIRVNVTLPRQSVVAGRYVTGKMEVECKSDKLGIGIIMVELFAFQELTSRDHSARMTFLHSRRLFQGPYLPPSNAVYVNPLPGDPPLPEDYYKAKRGHSTFLFRIPLPLSSPASINFANGLAKVRYEVRGSVSIFWKDERQLVTDKDEVGVLESYEEDLFDFGPGSRTKAEEGAVVVGENGRFWIHGRVIGGLLVAGESACVELQVKNHSSRKNTGLSLSLNRTLLLSSARSDSSSTPLRISDTILTVPFKGSEYTLPPGGEGVAHLVFDVPPDAKGVRGGTYEGDADEAEQTSEALFSVQASVEVKVAMGLGSKDVVLEIPVTIVHPDALPEPTSQPLPVVSEPILYPQYTSAPQQNHTRPLPQPAIPPYVDPHSQAWAPPVPYQYHHLGQAYNSPHAPQFPPYHEATLYPLQQPAHTHHNFPRQLPPRPSSAGPLSTSPARSQGGGYTSPISGLPITPSDAHTVLLPLPGLHPHPQTPTRINIHSHAPQIPPQFPVSPPRDDVDNRVQTREFTPNNSPQAVVGQREEGKGAVASRISRHLRQTSALVGRGRSVSPVAHRFGYPSTSGGDIVNGSAYPISPTEVADMAGIDVGQTADATSHPIAPPSNDPILHSPRPQIRHKQSFTDLNMNGEPLMKNDYVLELEKIAAVLGEPPPEEAKDEGKGKGREKPPEDINMNKTLPVPPPATKPRRYAIEKHSGASNGDIPLDALFAPPSPLSSPQVSAQGIAPPVPPTPTLIACKRPSRLPATSTSGGGAESGLDALERRLIAQVGTRKVEKERKPDVRNILAGGTGLSTTPDISDLRAKPSSKAESSAPSLSATPNLEGKIAQSGNGSASSERMLLPDESAISSLTLDQSSVGDVDADGHKESTQEQLARKERDGDEDEQEQEQEQESVDGGKTHKAGKSVVGVESYFQSRHHQSQQQHRRESAGVESHIVSRIAPTTNTKSSTLMQDTSTDSAPKKGPNKSKKSVQTRGRVTAWLGKIDPDAPPPQEEIIPPSPSVVRAVEWDLLDAGEEEGQVIGGFQPPTRSRVRANSCSQSGSPSPVPVQLQLSSTALRNSIHPQIDQVETATPSSAVATSPDPRSSGFMPIEKMKAQRDGITKSMTRSMLRGASRLPREATVAKEARRVMDIWAEEAPQASPSMKLVRAEAVDTSPKPASRLSHKQGDEGEKIRQKYLFMAPSPPKTQSIRTDQRLSRPSASVRDVNKPIPKVVEPQSAVIPTPSTTVATGDKQAKPRLTPSPVSYATVASRASPRPSGVHVIKDGPPKQHGLLPVFPPSTQPQEVKYDVKSARGGRGGQVTHVASLWASVAAGNAANNSGVGKSVVKPGVDAKKDANGLRTSGSPVVARDSPARTRPVPSSTIAPDPPKRLDPPLLIPRKSSATFSSGGPKTEDSRPQSKTPTPPSKPTPPRTTLKPPSKPATPKPKPTPPAVSKSPLQSEDSRTNRLAEKVKAAPIPVSIKKPTSLPAQVSSSLATPTLSSTASLVRPLGRAGSRTATIPVGLPGIERGDYKSAVIGTAESSRLNGAMKPGGVSRKIPGPGVVGKESMERTGMASMPQKSNARPGMIPTAIADVNAAKPNSSDSSQMREGDNIKRPPSDNTAFGQARLRDLIKKYQSSNA